MKLSIYVFVALCCFHLSIAIVCPPNYCDRVDCKAGEDELLRCEGRIDAHGSFCGCCPACIKQIGEGQACPMQLKGVPKRAECAQGLECDLQTRKCAKVRQDRQPVEQGACSREREQILQGEQQRPGLHLPDCLSDGSYDPRQCHESVCMCVDSAGKLTGVEAQISEAAAMTCACAHDQADYMKKGMEGKVFYCDKLGNYELVQCDGSMCYCADPATGKKLMWVDPVPVSQVSTLDCESIKSRRAVEQGACARERDQLLQGEEIRPGLWLPDCHEDGSYHPLQCHEQVCTCVDSEGKSTGVRAPVSQSAKMTCGCAREKADFAKTGMVGKTFSCNNLGNYELTQCKGSVCYCADPATGHQLAWVDPVPIGMLATLDCDAMFSGPIEQDACARELQMLDELPPLLGSRKPQCLEDGSYHPRQCHGSICTCVDGKGKETGYSVHISKASEMSCECARGKADYLKTGLIGKLFNCDELGNYKRQ